MANPLNEKKFINSFLLTPGVGYETMSRLKKFFPSYEEAWRASETEFKAAGVTEKTAKQLTTSKTRLDPDSEMERLSKEGIIFLEYSDPDFPELLKEIPSPPYWLYIKGGAKLNAPSLAIVGSRKATSYGREATEKIISGLSVLTDITIISGLATGIDAQAHISSLRHGLPAIAVIGTGLDRKSFFPPKNIRLSEDIIDKCGAIISEYPLGMPAFRQNFIQRNRIISGLSVGTLVVEAAEKSGALITARFALEQNKEVFAIPGSIFSPYSQGTNMLLKEGATPIFSAMDIIDELNLQRKTIQENKENPLTNESEKHILETLSEPLGLDELKMRIKIPAPDIISLLSMLELKGLIKNMNGKWTRI
ncbi:MAG: DNA-processing protein DprA [bacterium]|nr:DNA-processing protein DprA [bacterium]